MFKKLILILVFVLLISFPCVASAEDIYEEETIAGALVDSSVDYGSAYLGIYTGEWNKVYGSTYSIGEYVNFTYPTDDRFVYQTSLDIFYYLTPEQKYLVQSSVNTEINLDFGIEYFSDPGFTSDSFLFQWQYKAVGKEEVLQSISASSQPSNASYSLDTDYFKNGTSVEYMFVYFVSYFYGYGDRLVDMQYRIPNLSITLRTIGADKSTADIVVNLGKIEDSINQGFDQMGDKLDGVQDSINQGVENVTNKQDTIIDKISSGFANIGNQVKKAVTDAVTELFVPSEEDMVAQYDKWDSLMADRFGAVYESSQIIDNFVESIKVSDTQETINFPVVSVDLVGTTFEFGGWEVDVVPDGFQWLVDILKMVSNVGCTVLFINGMRSRYESVVK